MIPKTGLTIRKIIGTLLMLGGVALIAIPTIWWFLFGLFLIFSGNMPTGYPQGLLVIIVLFGLPSLILVLLGVKLGTVFVFKKSDAKQ
jgi:hypothetical protein